MSNQAFTKISNIAEPINDLTISNNLRCGGTIITGSIDKTLVVPPATEAPSDSPNNLIKITAEQSGTTFILTPTLNADGGFNQVFVLPPAKIGLNYTFIQATSAAATTGGNQYIMPYGYTVTGGNPAGSANGVAEAYAFSIQVVLAIGNAGPGNQQGAGNSEQINSLVGDATVVGGIMFDSVNTSAASLIKLTCVSTSVSGNVLTGVRWIGTGQMAITSNIVKSDA